MTLDKFTIKAQEAVQAAAGRAQSAGQQAVEPVHLLYGIMQKAKDVTDYLFGKLGVNSQQMERLVESEIAHLPRVQGGEPYTSPMRPGRCCSALRTRPRRWATSS